jgi:HK97 family phage major capsid protein
MPNARRAKLNQLLEKAAENRNKIKSILDEGDKNGGQDSAEAKQQIKALNQENVDLMSQAEELKAILEIQGGLEGGSPAPTNPAGHTSGGDGGSQRGGQTMKSLGEMFSDDPELKAWLDKHGPGLGVGRQTIQSPRVEVKSFFPNYLRALVTSGSDTSGGAFITPDFKPIVDQFYQRPLTIRDLVSQGQTGSDQIEYVRITGVTNNAAGVGEAQNTTFGDTSGRKPESAIEFERVVENVKTIAHWIPATTRALQDAPQLRSYIDAFLRYGIEEEVEDQMVNGTGGDDFTGIFETPDIQNQDFVTDILTTTRKARTLVRVNGRTAATAFVLNPNDWEIIDLSKDGNERYYFGGPLAMGQKTLWGLPVIESEALPEGTGLVANFKMAVLWDRLQSAISVSNSHNDFFVRNLVAILCEYRAAFGVIRPQAFVRIETQEPS